MSQKSGRDIEISYSSRQFAAKLRRLADALEQGKQFSIQVAGKRIHIPAGAVISVEHECSERSEEIEFQLKWTR